MLTLELLLKGRSRDIYALTADNRNATREYVCGLDRSAQRKLFARLQVIADTGWAGHDEQVIRRLKGSRVAHEVKEHSSNTRLFFFLHGRRMVVCTHGGPKPGRREIKNDIDKVERLHERCLREGVLS